MSKVEFIDVGRNKASWTEDIEPSESAIARAVKKRKVLMSRGIDAFLNPGGRDGEIVVGAWRTVGRFIIHSVLVAILTATAHASCLPDAPPYLAAYAPVPPPGYVGILALRVVVQWADVRTERSYKIERAVWTGTSWGPYVLLGSVPKNVTSFTDWQPVGRALYRVSSVNPCGESSSVFVYVPTL